MGRSEEEKGVKSCEEVESAEKPVAEPSSKNMHSKGEKRRNVGGETERDKRTGEKESAMESKK